MILVDTSIWIDHLHRSEPHLVELLERDEVATHPMVRGELALGSIRDRAEFLGLLANLPTVVRASDGEVLTFIEANALWSRGLSLVDAHLLAGAKLSTGTRLWTRDSRLRKAATALDLAYPTR